MTERSVRAAFLAVLAALAAGGCAHTTTPDASPLPETERRLAAAREEAAAREARELLALERELTPLERAWGIKLLGIRLTAGGYALDFRYKVLDPRKAAPLVQRRFSPVPYVIVERTGAKLGVPFTEKAGSLRSSVTTAEQIRRGRNYTALFANPGKHARAGDRVTVAFGGFRAERLIVQ